LYLAVVYIGRAEIFISVLSIWAAVNVPVKVLHKRYDLMNWVVVSNYTTIIGIRKPSCFFEEKVAGASILFSISM